MVSHAGAQRGIFYQAGQLRDHIRICFCQECRAPVLKEIISSGTGRRNNGQPGRSRFQGGNPEGFGALTCEINIRVPVGIHESGPIRAAGKMKPASPGTRVPARTPAPFQLGA